jgi:hypothetical protein
MAAAVTHIEFVLLQKLFSSITEVLVVATALVPNRPAVTV